MLEVLRRAPKGLSNREMEVAVAEEAGLSAEQRAIKRGTERSKRTLLDYRLAWARTLLKGMGAVENDGVAHWVITDVGRETTAEDIRSVAAAMLPNNTGRD